MNKYELYDWFKRFEIFSGICMFGSMCFFFLCGFGFVRNLYGGIIAVTLDVLALVFIFVADRFEKKYKRAKKNNTYGKQ